jgi:glycosyltransferase involved in cell wall biosynthesis
MDSEKRIEMNYNPLISIITVVKNGKKHLEQTILSVLGQTYNNIEYIVIDGASNDGSVEIIKKYEKQLAFWISEPDSGIYNAMNKGITHATGEYIGIINSDDFYEPNAVKTIVNELQNNMLPDIVFGNLYMINPNLTEKQLQTYKKGEKLYKSFSIWHPTVFVKKESYNQWGNFNEAFKLAADYELLLRFNKNGAAFKYINKTIANFREGGQSYYNNILKKERFRIHKMHTSCINAYFNLILSTFTEILQKIFMKIIGIKRYHYLRYKFLYH